MTILKTTYFNSTKSSYKVEHDDVVLYYSYKTPIAIYYKGIGNAIMTDKKYSATTSKQITTYITNDLGFRPESVSHDLFSEILRNIVK